MSDLSKHTILIVDDELDNLEVFKAALEMLYSSTVRTASSGDAALSAVATEHPTMIVTDLSMPKMDGYALLHKLRERPDTSKLPIIAITAHAMAGDRERILDAGFDGYISKPFDISTIADDLDGCLNGFNAKHPGSAVTEPAPTVTQIAPAVTESAPTATQTADAVTEPAPTIAQPDLVNETVVPNGAPHAA